MFGLFAWHIWYAPKWLLALTWNLERAAARYFSAAIMLRTLVSHWHKDAVSYRQGTAGGIALAFAWNMISRGIGFVVRTLTLAVYAVAALSIAFIGLSSILLFWVWPPLAVIGIIFAVRLLS